MSYTLTARSPSDDERLPRRSRRLVACYPGIQNGARSPVARRCRWPPFRRMPQLRVSCSGLSVKAPTRDHTRRTNAPCEFSGRVVL